MTTEPSIAAAVETIIAARAAAAAPTGAVLAVAEGDDVRVAAAGVEDLDTLAPVGPRHAQDLASVSKVLTTLAVLGLVGRGALTLDTTLGGLLGARAGDHADATVEDLLRHRGGMAPWWPLYLEPDAADDPVTAALARPPIGRPGGAATYSDLGMMVLGAVVEHVGGAPLPDMVRHLVLEPVGAGTTTPGAPADGVPSLSGPDGDAIEREMVRSGVPYAVTRRDDGFPWRTDRITREPADGNAFHVFRGAAGHAGWFSDVDGLIRIAAALLDPAIVGVDPRTQGALAVARDGSQALGVRRYGFRWRGRDRVLLGHPGFTGAFVGAAPAVADDPPLRFALLANRLHGRPAPGRGRLVDVETLWRTATASADSTWHHDTSGARQ